MKKKGTLTKILAVAGTVLGWFPVLAPILISAISSIQRGRFNFDFLMPAELFLFSLVGGGLLLWAALRARSHWKLIAGGLGFAVILIISVQLIAVVTGLASGETQATEWMLTMLIAVMAVYTMALAASGVGGILLVRDLFKAPHPLA